VGMLNSEHESSELDDIGCPINPAQAIAINYSSSSKQHMPGAWLSESSGSTWRPLIMPSHTSTHAMSNVGDVMGERHGEGADWPGPAPTRSERFDHEL
jgi:hypothetical protein